MAINARDDRPSGGVARLPRRDSTPNFTDFSGSHDAVDLMQLWSTLCRSYRLVLLVALLVFCAAMYRTLTSPMQFQASGRLYLGELDGNAHPAPAQNTIEFSGTGQGELGSEIEIIHSRSLVSRAILASGMNVPIAPVGEEPPVFWRWLLSRRDSALLDRGLREVRAVNAILSEKARDGLSFELRFKTPESYELYTENRLVAVGKLGELLKTDDFELTLVQGADGSPKAGSRYEMGILPLEELTDDAVGMLDVYAPKGTNGPVNVVTLEFSSSSPRAAAAFLTHLMEAYLQERQSWKTEDATAAETFVTSQLRTIRESLDNVQKQLATYRTNNRVVVLDSEAKAMIEQIAKYEEQRVAARLQVAALADMKRALSSKDPPMGAYLVGEARDTVLEGMSSSLSQARHKLTELESQFNDVAPPVQEQRAQVKAQLEAVQNYVASRLSRAQESLGTLSGIIGQFEQKLKTVPSAEFGLAQLSRESEVYNRTYSYLLERQQQAAIVKASTLSKNRILDVPRVSDREDSPKLALGAASGLVGVALGVALVLLHSIFAGTLQSESDVHRSIGASPIWARIPRRRRARAVGPAFDGQSFELPAGHADSRFVEAFRALRTSVYHWAASARSTVVLITSPAPGDGKTTCAHWLAAALATDGRRVLVIDADLRRPVPKAEATSGREQNLRSALLGTCDWHEAVRRVPLSFGEFYLLPGGGMARAELLSSERMSQLVSQARHEFDFVVIDSPSFPFVSDGLTLAALSDMVLSVMRLQNTPRRVAVDHARRMSASSSFAVVVNDAGATSRRRHSYPRSEDPSAGSSDGTNQPVTRGHWQRAGFAAAGLVTRMSGGAPFSATAEEDAECETFPLLRSRIRG
jgi:tyrosine-protein kinase Etk/Wzc